jgi:hypothetical protein
MFDGKTSVFACFFLKQLAPRPNEWSRALKLEELISWFTNSVALQLFELVQIKYVSIV